MNPVLRTLTLVGLLIPAALADDFYVDAQNGSNAATGGPGDPWRTLTHAIAQVPAGTHNVLVATGTYDTAHGEVFPIHLGPGQTIRGTGDVVVHSAGNANCFYYQSQTFGPVVLDTLRLRGGGGISALTDWGDAPVSLTLTNLDASLTGGLVSAESSAAIAGGGSITLENVHVHDGGSAIYLDQWDCSNTFGVNATDCTFERLERAVGETNSSGITSGMTFTRCRFSDLQWEAISAQSTNLILDSCLIENSRSAVDVNTSGGSVTLRHTTIVGNTLRGVASWGYLTTIRDSILWDNGDDLNVPGGSLSVQNSNIGDGDHQGQNGTISQDPLFRSAASGDYRLSFGSPSVDTGGLAGTDLDGFPFDSDGDLDTIPAPDMGAYELRTLVALGTARIGTKLHLDASGRPDQFTVFYLGRSEPMTVPDVTPFGRRWIPQIELELIGTHKILGPGGVRHTVNLPNAQALIGLTFSFQALTRSTAAPAGAAWSDVVAVEFRP